MLRTFVLVALLAACGGTSATYHAFAISSDVPATGDDFASALYQSVGATMAPGHTVKRLDNGAMFDSLVTDIDRAATSVDILMYIWEDGRASTRLSTALIAKARAGVTCRIVIDSFGSPDFEKTVSPALVAAGCVVKIFRPFPAHSPLLRNHRKVFVVDGTIAYAGGHCVRDEWLGTALSDKEWRDTSVRFTGPAVREAQQAFAENWQEAGGALLPADAFPTQSTEGSTRLAFVSSTASPNITRAERLTLLAIAAAHKRLWITNAYFVPSDDVIALLKQKATAGVDVRILVPDEHDDSKVALVAQRRLYPQLAKTGIRVWEYQPSMVHAKTMVVDDTLSVIGSINMDPLSLNKLDEVAVVIDDAAFTDGLAQAFVTDCTHGTLEAGPAK
ncbi:MAG TPA: phospholipase D-like domain-containing protein [Kofleriaceae bacterium]|jgi:cardiolipin synthase